MNCCCFVKKFNASKLKPHINFFVSQSLAKTSIKFHSYIRSVKKKKNTRQTKRKLFSFPFSFFFLTL